MASNASDIESDDEEFLPIRRRHVPPAFRQPIELDELEEGNRGPSSSTPTWREGSTPPANLPFTGQSGLQVEMEDTSPLDYLKLMVTDEMVASLVTETNRYAEQTLEDKELSPKSRFRQWTPVTLNEMWAFLGLIIAMGLILIENLEEYWSLHAMYKLPFFSSVLKKDRFCLILSFLHIANNKDQLKRDDPA
ncbi:PiggyBac transposable element-derived protein 4 [Elysia marginata]|uniref:PiggyBac transposable element-derived protein 4 n=1 Tax=Elysia marginata TaxID=1093978 RepID=A0AAV4ILR4_9GAST|nr:PiggyBac transposable element-derived protein 4 [Elysia marginata]